MTCEERPRTLRSAPEPTHRNSSPLRIPYNETVIYEAHVKGMTMRHPDVPQALRGTYSGLAHPAMIRHLQELGVTAVELMPVHQFVHDSTLDERGLCNYWGYNTIGFFAPHNGYASFGTRGQQVLEFKAMVRALHRGGHRGDPRRGLQPHRGGQPPGPTLSFRGMDNQAYYRLVEGDRKHYYDTTGTGNSLNVRHHESLRLIMDSLRYWVLEMHVDGFRFDLASALAREFHEVDRLSAFFDLVNQDPVVSQVKLIAEPWDVGEGGYQVGGFPSLWTEWNGQYRDTVRDFWRGGRLEPRASSRCASPDPRTCTRRTTAGPSRRSTSSPRTTASPWPTWSPTTTSTTLANGEDERDGESYNRSWNCGVEGPTEDDEVSVLRERQKRNFLTTLLLSQGVPMISHGDELGRTQQGNNNVYCQDNELSWIDWDAAREHEVLTEFTARLAALRRAHPVFRRQRFFQGRPIRGSSIDDIAWLRPDGRHMTEQDWDSGRDPASRSSSTAAASRTATRSASGSSTTRSCCW